MTPRFFRLLALAIALSSAPVAPLWAQDQTGAYLAARQASMARDYEAAAGFYLDALQADPTNPALLENLMVALIGLGDFDRAGPIAQQLIDTGVESQIANIATIVQAGRSGQWESIFSGLEAGRSVGPLVDGLAQSWAFVGQGQVTQALASFDEVIDAPGLRSFGLYHKALALASVGDFEGADAILSLAPEDGMQRTRRGALVHAEVLSQLGRNADAVAMLTTVFGDDLDSGLQDLADRLQSGTAIPYSFVATPADGLAEVFYTVAQALDGEAEDDYVLVYARAAQALRPGHVDATLYAADLLERIGRYDLANAAYAQVPQDDPAFLAAELGRAGVLRQDGKGDAAIEVLQQLTRTHGDMAIVHAELGDALRQMQDMKGANAAYTQAVDLTDDSDPSKWFILYARGITFERLGDWPMAEADFRASLALNPGHPSVLNYLGYSMVEKGVNLDEALAMIEQAAAAQPDSGAIIDSLGWVLFRLGRYGESITYMERAAELEPADPVVNDHLGDALWAVGRKVEARFQWQRALSFDPEDVDATRIRRKLDNGLDAVLAEDGAPPLSVVSDK